MIRTDFGLDKNNNYKTIYNNKKYNIKVSECTCDNYIYRIIKYKDIINKNNIKNVLKKELLYYFNLYNINNNSNILIIGLGNDANTADSIGCKSIKYITPNFEINKLFNSNNIKISTLEPGVLGTTGIDTSKIIKKITNMIKPNLIILIDSFLTNNINNLNKCIEINNEGIIPGSGLYGNNSKINKKTTNSNILVIGIPVSLEYIKDNTKLLMSLSNIDKYASDISYIIGSSINELLYNI